MKKFASILFLIFCISFANAQTPPFEGTWKWISGNQTFYVYIMNSNDNEGHQTYRLDYSLKEITNNIESEIYSSKFDGQFFWAGAFLSQPNINDITKLKGDIKDCTHPYTTDCYQGTISLEYISLSGGKNSQPKIHWKLLDNYRGIYGYYTNNPPTGFNLPTDIILIKVN